METHRYLLDTNIISALAKEPQGNVFRRLKEVMPATVCTSVIVAAEIQYGIHKGVSKQLRTQVNTIMSEIDILPLETPVTHIYGKIRARLQRLGQMIGSNDLFIAAHACTLDLILVTRNLREFSRVPNLKLENWLD